MEQQEAISQAPGEAQAPYERALIVIETCDQVLAAVGGEVKG